ncbi:MAG: hypothetical protein WA624_20290 [Methylocella sp.]
MNFSLVLGPLPCAPNQKYNLCFNRFYIPHRLIGRSIFVAPDVKVRLRQHVTPSVAVVAALPHAAPTKP